MGIVESLIKIGWTSRKHVAYQKGLHEPEVDCCRLVDHGPAVFAQAQKPKAVIVTHCRGAEGPEIIKGDKARPRLLRYGQAGARDGRG